jgi:hypothetical protein
VTVRIGLGPMLVCTKRRPTSSGSSSRGEGAAARARWYGTRTDKLGAKLAPGAKRRALCLHLGDTLYALTKTGVGGKGGKGGNVSGGAAVEPPETAPTLAELGIDKKVAARSQRRGFGSAFGRPPLGRGGLCVVLCEPDTGMGGRSAGGGEFSPETFRAPLSSLVFFADGGEISPRTVSLLTPSVLAIARLLASGWRPRRRSVSLRPVNGARKVAGGKRKPLSQIGTRVSALRLPATKSPKLPARSAPRLGRPQRWLRRS